MKFLRTLALVLALTLVFGVSAANAVDSAEVESVKMQNFYTSLVELGLIPTGETLEVREYTGKGAGTAATYSLTDFMYVATSLNAEGVKKYELSIAYAVVTDDIDPVDLSALFIMAVSGQDLTQEEAKELFLELSGRAYRSGYYSMTAGMKLDGTESTMILDSSITDSEVFLTIVQYPDDAPY